MTATHVTTTFTPSSENAITECHTMVHVTAPQLTFAEQLQAVLAEYRQLFDGNQQRPLFRRFFLSDAANQQSLLEKALEDTEYCATSIVQQPPLDGTKIALWVWSASLPEDEGCIFTHNG